MCKNEQKFMLEQWTENSPNWKTVLICEKMKNHTNNYE